MNFFKFLIEFSKNSYILSIYFCGILMLNVLFNYFGRVYDYYFVDKETDLER